MSKGKGTQEKEDVFKELGAWDTWGGAKGAGEAGERGWTQMVKSMKLLGVRFIGTSDARGSSKRCQSETGPAQMLFWDDPKCWLM